MSHIKFLGAEKVLKYLPFDELYHGLKQGFVDYTNGNINQPPRTVIPLSNNNFYLVKPVISVSNNAIATKMLTIFGDNEEKHGIPNIQSVITLFDASNGCVKAIMDGNSVTNRRTAVATVVATKFLSRNHDGILAVIGTGYQGKSHVEAFKALCSFKEIRVFSRNEEKRRTFAKENDVICSSSVEECVKDADVIVTVTMSKSPVVFKKWVKPGALINIVGAPTSKEREIGDELMRTSQIFADSKVESEKSAGDFVQTNAKVEWELGSVIEGKAEIDWEQIRLFKSNGMAIQDLISAKIVVDNIEKAGSDVGN